MMLLGGSFKSASRHKLDVFHDNHGYWIMGYWMKIDTHCQVSILNHGDSDGSDRHKRLGVRSGRWLVSRAVVK